LQHAHAHGGATDAGPTDAFRHEALFYSCEVRDGGQIHDLLAGRVRPGAEEIGGRGLWLVNHLCGLVQIRSSAGGTVVRLHLALAA